MFQSFKVASHPEQGPPRLQALRLELSKEGLDGFVIPRADAHQGEYVNAHDERLSWLSGFTGSAGFCVALQRVAGVFIDGRYRTQVKQQVASAFTPVHWPEITMAQWLIEQLPQGGKIGFDPWLHTVEQIEQARKALANTGIVLEPCDNLVDRIWSEQPAPAQNPVQVHALEYAGESHFDKRARLAKGLREANQDSAVITLPDSICWLLNIRGADIARNPIAQGFAILHRDARVDLFMNKEKLQEVKGHLGDDVALHDPEAFIPHLQQLNGAIRLDRLTVPVFVAQAVGENAQWGGDPCALPKACKNTAEIEGSAAAHLRDGAAVVETLAWLDKQPAGSLSEIDVVERLEANRRKDPALKDISFETICGTGPNGAIMHYRVDENSNSVLEEGHLLVLDSGGQYLDGTTDITRTIAIGTPNTEARSAFTRVLQGMINMSRLRWPKGLAGRDIEMIGRLPLWMAGQDFDHGLGHGVGAYLSVHEGPQRLSRVSTVPLQEGMILSNEPGYYREGAFGIRIENLIVVQEAGPLQGADDHRQMLSWRTLTFAPIDRRLIDVEMLDDLGLEWLNAYHAQTYEQLAPFVSDQAKTWLKAATARLER